MKNEGFGRSFLRICAVLCTIGTVLVLLLAVLALTNRFPEINQTFMDMFKNETYYAQLPANFPGLALMVAFAFSLIETYLMWRAVRDPKKSSFLIFIFLVSLIGSGIEVFIRGTVSSSITSIVWSAVILIALLCARSEAAIAVEASKAKTTKSTKTTKTVKEPKKEDVKTTEK